MIDLATLDEAGFDRLYAAQIDPIYRRAEAERQTALGVFRSRLQTLAPLAVLGGLLVWAFSGALAFGFVAAGFGLFGAFAHAQGPLNALRQSLKQETLGALAAAMGCSYTPNAHPQPVVARQRGLDLLPSYDRAKFEDWFHGERLSCAFDLFEAHLEREQRDKDGDRSYVTVFRGVVVRLAFPKAFQGVTVVRRDAGVFNAVRGWGSRLQRVGFADPSFERNFEVYSDDQVEARYLVHPVFAERLLQLEQQLKGGKLRCAFEGGDLLVALESENKFEIKEIFKPLDNPGQARRIVEDLAAVLRLMDAVLTTERAALAVLARESL